MEQKPFGNNSDSPKRRRHSSSSGRRRRSSSSTHSSSSRVERTVMNTSPQRGSDRSETKTKKKASPIYTILIVICAIIFLGSAGILGYQFWEYQSAEKLRGDLSDLVLEVEPEEGSTKKPLVDYSNLYQINSDFIGWIEIDGTRIDYPVVKYTDNDKYLNTDFYGNKHKLGTVFADYRNQFENGELSDNTVLYGHSAADGSYFANVRKYKDIDYYKEHPFASFNTMTTADDWVIFGVIMIDALDDSESNFMYHNALDFNTEEEYQDFIGQIEKRNYFETDIEYEYGDQFITLSTCDYDFDESRFVLFARKLREGETKESFDFSTVVENKDKVMPDRW